MHDILEEVFLHQPDKAQNPQALCDSLPETGRDSCFEGVWMEFFWGNTGHAGANSLGWSINTPLASCQHARGDEKPTSICLDILSTDPA